MSEKNQSNWGQIVAQNLAKLRENKPLIYNLTNFVTMNDVANALAAIGASPVMSTAPEEAAELISYAGALLLNPGTLNRDFNELVKQAVEIANATGKPCVLDPVGSGATRLRTETFQALLNEPAVKLVRGNLGEIVSLAGVTAKAQTKGVDSVNSGDESDEALRATLGLQQKRGHGAVCATGKTDTVTDGRQVVRINNGHHWLPAISGSGCTVGGLCAAFLAVSDPLEAAVSGLVSYAVAAEIAAEHSAGPGTLKVNIFDALYNLNEVQILERIRVESYNLTEQLG